jgi:hypothetical protein
MKVRQMLYEPKAGSELIVKLTGVITCNVQAAAFRRPLGAKGRNDDVASGLDGLRDLPHVRSAVLHIRQEVEYGSVVP